MASKGRLVLEMLMKKELEVCSKEVKKYCF